MIIRKRYPRRYAAWPLNMWTFPNRLHQNMEFVLGGTKGPIQANYPAINAWQSDHGLIINAELPGVNPDDIEISLVDNTLTLSGARNPEKDGIRFIRRERRSGEFSRSLELPFKTDADSISAKYENGILELNIPRLPEESPKKILVQTT